MNDPDSLVLRAAVHPNRTVHRFGFDLDHPYLEQCWTPILGPASVVLLRRVSTMWRDAEPAHTTISQLAGEIGLSPTTMRRVLHRIQQFGFAAPTTDTGVVDVYSTAVPLAQRQLDQVPASTVRTHEQLLNEQLCRAVEPAPNSIAHRLDRLQHQTAAPRLTR